MVSERQHGGRGGGGGLNVNSLEALLMGGRN